MQTFRAVSEQRVEGSASSGWRAARRSRTCFCRAFSFSPSLSILMRDSRSSSLAVLTALSFISEDTLALSSWEARSGSNRVLRTRMLKRAAAYLGLEGLFQLLLVKRDLLVVLPPQVLVGPHNLISSHPPKTHNSNDS